MIVIESGIGWRFAQLNVLWQEFLVGTVPGEHSFLYRSRNCTNEAVGFVLVPAYECSIFIFLGHTKRVQLLFM